MLDCCRCGKRGPASAVPSANLRCSSSMLAYPHASCLLSYTSRAPPQLPPPAGADPERVKREIEEVIGLDCSNAIMASAKQGIGIQEILEEVVRRVPPPKDNRGEALRALIFDSYYDAYKGRVGGAGRGWGGAWWVGWGGGRMGRGQRTAAAGGWLLPSLDAPPPLPPSPAHIAQQANSTT